MISMGSSGRMLLPMSRLVGLVALVASAVLVEEILLRDSTSVASVLVVAGLVASLRISSAVEHGNDRVLASVVSVLTRRICDRVRERCR